MSPALQPTERAPLFWRLILKDWHFHRGSIAATFLLGAIALACIGAGRDDLFYLGSVLFVTVLIGMGILLVLMTIVFERKEQTLPFILSLPTSPVEYSAAKIVANLTIFLVPWLALLIGGVAMISARQTLANGLIPFFILISGEILAAYCVIVAVAMITESEGWTIGAIVTCNLFLNYFLFSVANLPGVGPYMEGPRIVWSPAVYTILAVEILVCGLALGSTFYLQSRKKDFL